MAGSNMESQNPNDIYGKYIMSRARQCCRPALLLHACFPGGRAARRPGLLPGRFPCGDRGGPERGRETADLSLFQRAEQCGGNGVHCQRLYRPGQARYFPVRTPSKSPLKLRGLLRPFAWQSAVPQPLIFCPFLFEMLAFYSEVD